MIEIPNIRLQYPRIAYKSATFKTADENSGRWDLKNTKFLESGFTNSKRLVRWKLITGPGIDPGSITALTTHFNEQLKQLGVCTDPQRLGAPVPVANLSYDGLRNALNDLIKDKDSYVPDIVILLLERSDQNIYSTFKYLTDKVFILQSICVTEEKMKPKNSGWTNRAALGQYMANVAMKANLKRAGINHSAHGVDQWLQNTLVLGADVTHPGSGAVPGSPSIAAVVGSLEASGGRFRGNMQMQAPKKEVRHLLQQISCEV
jgi:eukaryotic translation initiation factor 2C